MYSKLEKPVDMEYFREADRLYQIWHEPYDHMVCPHIDRNQFRQWTDLSQIIQRNSHLIQTKIGIHKQTRSTQEELLATHFPIIGTGTTAIVYDIGTCVLKSVVMDARDWEFDLFKFAKSIPLLYTETIPLHFKQQPPCNFYVQEKLTPIKAVQFADKINEIYHINTTDCLSWEWGIDQLGIPHVYDWG